jgi:hypothetical protein
MLTANFLMLTASSYQLTAGSTASCDVDASTYADYYSYYVDC